MGIFLFTKSFVGVNIVVYVTFYRTVWCWHYVFLKTAKCICQNCRMYLSKNCVVITLCLLSLCLAAPSLALSAQVVFCQRKSYRSEVISSGRQKRKENIFSMEKRKYRDWAVGKYKIKESRPAWDKCLLSLGLMWLSNSSQKLVE